MRTARILLTVLALLLTGCRGVAGIIDALAKDDASICLTMVTSDGTARLYRTKVVNGTVRCSDDGMAVTSGVPEVTTRQDVTTTEKRSTVTAPK